MDWGDFCLSYDEWSESTIRTRISSLEDIGDGAEIVSVVDDLDSEKLKAQLIRKAIKLNAKFEYQDYLDLEYELFDDVFKELTDYTGFNVDYAPIDENNLDWETFYENWGDWSNDDLKRRITKLKSFGSAEEVCEVIFCLPNSTFEDMLYEKAISNGVKFSRSQKEDMGRLSMPNESISSKQNQRKKQKKSNHRTTAAVVGGFIAFGRGFWRGYWGKPKRRRHWHFFK